MTIGELIKESTKIMFVAFIGSILGVVISTYMNNPNRDPVDAILVLIMFLICIFGLTFFLWVNEKYSKK